MITLTIHVDHSLKICTVRLILGAHQPHVTDLGDTVVGHCSLLRMAGTHPAVDLP